MDKEGIIHHVKTIISINTHMLTADYKISSLLRESVRQNIEISDYTINSMKSGLCIPGVDKLFILGILLNVDPRSFMDTRDGEGFNQFLSLSAEKKRVAYKLFNLEGNK